MLQKGHLLSYTKKGVVPFILCALITTWFIFFTSKNFDSLTNSCILNFDRSLLQLSVELAKGGEALTGAFSHAGFRHPGPSSFYLLAPLKSLFSYAKCDHGSIRLATLLLNASLLLICVLLLLKAKGSLLGVALFTASLLVLSSEPHRFYLVDYWNPYLNIAASALFLLSTALALTSKARWFAACLAFGSLLIQNHIGAIPFVVPIIFTCFLFIIFRRNTSTTQREKLLTILLSLTVITLLWWAPLLEIFRSKDLGNLSLILNQFGNNQALKSSSEVFALFIEFLKPIAFFNAPLVTLASIVLLPIIAFKKLDTFKRALYILSVSGLALSFVSAHKIFVPLATYLLSYLFGLLPILVFLACESLIVLLSVIFKNKNTYKIGILLQCLISFVLFYNVSLPKLETRSFDDDRQLSSYVEALKPSESKRYKLIPIAPKLNGFMAYFSLEMKKQGFDTCVEDHFGFLFDFSQTCSYKDRYDPKDEMVEVKISRVSKTIWPLNERRFVAKRIVISW